MAPNLNRQQGEPGGLNAIQAANYGGLNTISNPLNMPVEDAASLLNMRVTQIGTIAKRKGTEALRSEIADLSSTGTQYIPYTLRNGTRILIGKEGTRLRVYRLKTNALPANQEAPRLVQEISFDNVWSTEARGVKCSYVVTSEPTARVIMATGINTVVQLSIVQTTALASGSVITSGDGRLVGMPETQVLLFENGVYIDRSLWSISGGGVITLTYTPPGAAVYDIVACSWQWWAEAMRLNGKQITREVTQFQINNPTDLTVSIPTDLMYDIEPLGSANYPISAYSTNNPLTFYTPVPTSSSATQYVWTQGAAYVAGATPVPGFTFIAFGAFTAALPTTPKRVILYRHYRLPFKGFTGTTVANICVFDTERNWTLNPSWVTILDDYPKSGTDAAPTYGIANVTSGFSVATISSPASGSVAGRWIRFDSSNNTRITASDSVSVVSLDVLAADGNRNIGTAATQTPITFNSSLLGTGAPYPVYGLYEICDFAKRSFPRTITLYSGRLVLAGFPDAPLRVCLSNVLDSSVAGSYYNNFQTLLEPVSDSNALFFELNGNADDSITAVAEFQNNLFIFCKKGIYRLSGSDSGSVTPTAFNVSFVASIGCVNPQCVVRVDKTLYFLSQAGMYDIVPTIEAGDFTAGERSLKIKNLFNKTSSVTTEISAWVEYDPVFQEVYVGIPDTSLESTACSRIFVYNILRDSWTEYAQNMSGRWHNIGAAVLINGISQGRDVIVFTIKPNDLTKAVPLLIDSDRYIDGAWTTEYTVSAGVEDNGTTSVLSGAVTPMWYDTTSAHVIDTRITEYFTISKFPLIPVETVIDCEVFVEGVKQTYGVDWYKTARNSVILLKLFQNGDDLVIRKVNEEGNIPLAVYVDNMRKVPNVDYTTTLTGITWINTPATGSIITTGIEYEAYHFTPLMTLENLDIDKRFMRYIGYYRNTDYQEVYETTDINTNTSQDLTALIHLPKVRADVSVAFIYQDNQEGYVSTDIYGFADLYWDVALTDVTPSALQYRHTTRIVENLLGLSYGVQVVNYNRSDGAFELAGYQVVARAGGRHSRHWSS